MKTVSLLLISIALVVFSGFSGDRSSNPKREVAQPRNLPSSPTGGATIPIDFSQAGPREVEDKTEATVARDYSRAWRDLERALEQNRTDLLASSFTGIAQEKLAARITGQRKAGLSTRYVDHGHRAQAVFYSPEGSAIQLRDAVQLEIQILDGGTVISRQSVTLNYLAIMTATQDGWRVRLLQEAAGQ